MSKGNMLLGYARGKVGDVVMARSLGSQQTRAYNDRPKNPKTELQMNQRVKMLNLINFYKFSKNYLQYEKGGSNTKYSTFNKFVRYNIANIPNYLTKQDFLDNVTIPNDYFYSIGSLAWPVMPFQVAAGSANGTIEFSIELNYTDVAPFTFQAGDSASYVFSTVFKYFGAKSTNANLTIFAACSASDTDSITDAMSFTINPKEFENFTYSNLQTGLAVLGGKVLLQISVGASTTTIKFSIVGLHADNTAKYSTTSCWSLVDGGRLKVSTSKITMSTDLETSVAATYQTEQARINSINSYKVGEPIELRTGTPVD